MYYSASLAKKCHCEECAGLDESQVEFTCVLRSEQFFGATFFVVKL